MAEDIIVKNGNSRVPFSRGILTRSLSGLGLDATRAYDIAEKIYMDLRSDGISQLSTEHLARVLSARIHKFAGEEFGERYEKIRLFKRSRRPLVLLIGGSTGSGKSTLASEIGHRLDVTRIQSTDSVRHVMRSMISERLLPSIHRSSFENFDTEAWSLAQTEDPVVSGLLEQVRHVSVAVRAVIERAIDEKLSTILEGVHLVPGLFESFANEPRIQFVHVVVYVGGEEAHRARFARRARSTSARPESRYLSNFQAIRTIQSYLLQRADAEGLPRVENQDINSSVHATLGHILAHYGDSSPVSFTVRKT